MPPRNNPLPAAVRLFNCAICDKGYPRQLDYENHLGSYDHNHRQRLADMKKLTASNEPESSKPKQGLDMRSIRLEDANKKPALGGRFTKIGGPAAGSRFKKVVGVAPGSEKDESVREAEKKEAASKEANEDVKMEDEAVVAKESPSTMQGRPSEKKMAEAMASRETVVAAEDHEEDMITWEEYDFTKPTGCDDANCPGCKTDGIWNGEWLLAGAV